MKMPTGICVDPIKELEKRRNHSEFMKGRHPSKKTRLKMGASHRKRYENPNERIKISKGMKKYYEDSESHKKVIRSLTGHLVSEATRRKIGAKHKGKVMSEVSRQKMVESKLGGFWYGNVRYSDPPKYCELWCPDLWHRIDEAQNYQSILSGKTKFDNGGRALSRHHVYWQPRACCEWDDDVQGYYAKINIGTRRKSNWYRYYIPGDPNKFVLLTTSEHQMIRKNKLKWIKVFEDLIETKLNGVCYLPKVI